jgi:hypothetical protein
MLDTRISRQWDDDIVPQLIDYIRLPAKSPHFDPEWQRHGHIEAAVAQAHTWAARQGIKGLKLEVVRLERRTPVLFFDVPATGSVPQTVVFYGHLDKQPEMTGWRPGFGPWTPVVEGGRLYGRGGADDGYAVFAALSAIGALDAEGVARPRCVGLIETCEESGSYDLPAYLDALAPRMGDVALVIALDSGAGNYDQLWVTTSLRGLVNGTLRVDILDEGVHSGDAGGVVPSSFRIARQLLDRIDDSRTGIVKGAAFSCAGAAGAPRAGEQAARILGDTLWKRFPWSCCDGPARPLRRAGDQGPGRADPQSHLARRARGDRRRRPAADRSARATCSARTRRSSSRCALPPARGTARRPVAELEEDPRRPIPPYNARISFECGGLDRAGTRRRSRRGLAERLDDAVEPASSGAPRPTWARAARFRSWGCWGRSFPGAQILVTGACWARSPNAHGPNEFIDIGYAKSVLLPRPRAVIAAMPGRVHRPADQVALHRVAAERG